MARNDIIGSLPGGLTGNVSEYNRSLEGSRQNQLKAQAMGLDLQQYEFYKRHPADYINQHKQFFDPDTGKFRIPDVVPGALISNGGPVLGPNGMVLAAGSSPTNPVDLSSVKPVSPIEGAGHSTDTSAWITQNLGGTPATSAVSPQKAGQSQRVTDADIDASQTFLFGAPIPRDPNRVLLEQPDTGAQNFLPPYLQPGAPKVQTGTLTPITPPSTFGTPPLPTVNQMAPMVPQSITPQGSPLAPFTPNATMSNRGMGGGNSFESTAKLLQLPFYLRSLYGR